MSNILQPEIDRVLAIFGSQNALAVLANQDVIADIIRKLVAQRDGLNQAVTQYSESRDLWFLEAKRLASNQDTLVKRVEQLEAALHHYSLATVVSSWGYEELAPNWDVARDALGLPAPNQIEKRIALGEPEPPEEAEDIE